MSGCCSPGWARGPGGSCHSGGRDSDAAAAAEVRVQYLARRTPSRNLNHRDAASAPIIMGSESESADNLKDDCCWRGSGRPGPLALIIGCFEALLGSLPQARAGASVGVRVTVPSGSLQCVCGCHCVGHLHCVTVGRGFRTNLICCCCLMASA